MAIGHPLPAPVTRTVVFQSPFPSCCRTGVVPAVTEASVGELGLACVAAVSTGPWPATGPGCAPSRSAATSGVKVQRLMPNPPRIHHETCYTPAPADGGCE